MKKSIFLCFIWLCSYGTMFSQNSTEALWDHILKNDREAASKLAKKISTNSIETLVSKELLSLENGYVFGTSEFIEDFTTYKDYEYYLYALWNSPFVFDNYISEGFTHQTGDNLKHIMSLDVKNHAIKDALNYLNAIWHRSQGDWETYYEFNDKNKVLRHWQYCGVFENLNKSGLDKVYEPEIIHDKQVFDAGVNGVVGWYTFQGLDGIYNFMSNHGEYGSGVHYAKTYIDNPNAQDVIIRIGNSSAFKLWVNDTQVFENLEDVSTELNGYEVRLKLPKGLNKIMIKLAEKSRSNYFTMAVLDTDRKPIQAINGKATLSTGETYNQSTKASLDPKPLENEFEAFFKAKLKEDAQNFVYTYALFRTYLRNNKNETARELLKPWLQKYTKSSLLRQMMSLAYSSDGISDKVTELKKNIELDDPNYYIVLVSKISDYSEIERMTMEEAESFVALFKEKVKHDILKTMGDLMLAIKRTDMEQMKSLLQEIINNSLGNTKLKIKLAETYGNAFNDSEKTKAVLEDVVANQFSYAAMTKLVTIYEKENKLDKMKAMLLKYHEYLSHDNAYLKYVIRTLHEHQEYEASLKYIDKALKNFPYSFVTLELKGDALYQLKREKEALQAYDVSLMHNSNHLALRNKIRTIKEEANILTALKTDNVYEFIERSRGKINMNNYGRNILLDDSNVELYKEGGGRYRNIQAYEITSNSGVEYFKEYNLGLSGNYHISKSEVVKPDGSIVPAEKSGSNLVFNTVSIGDVVYLDFENSFASSGRFYKDFSDKFMLGSYHPVVQSELKIAVPDGVPLKYKMINSDIQPKIKKQGRYKVYTWDSSNIEVLKPAESYMPSDSDIASYVHLSTIKDWNEVAIWYSDLVKSRIKYDAVVKDVFEKLFPKGITGLSEVERAEIIYNYIRKEFNYSYVSFKQSGFVPQKPSKTILSKLGDCKDFSTLFVTLAKEAELNANLVLVETSEYGRNSLVLPSTSFNHCIVKVMLNGDVQFLELTDKYLPFRALPTSLRGASILEIPFDSNKKTAFDLKKLDDVRRSQADLYNEVDVTVFKDSLALNIHKKMTGHITSSYAGIFAEPNNEVIEKNIYEDFGQILSDKFTLHSIKDVENLEKDKVISYTSALTIHKKTNKIGSFHVFQLPMVAHPYTKDIVDLDNRVYPINYIDYEHVDTYKTVYNVYLLDGKSFLEYPENETFTFKAHSYSMTYEKVKANHLKVTIMATTSLERIAPEDYQAFKTYVLKILESNEALIGYK